MVGREYKMGSVYTLKVDALRVRTGAGTNYRAKAYHELSVNAKKYAYTNGTLKKGTKVTCQSVKTVSGKFWNQWQRHIGIYMEKNLLHSLLR